MPDHSMHDEQGRPEEKIRRPAFWQSRAGLALIAGLAVAGLLLGFEHRIHIFGSGWLLWLPLLICVGMHFFMHGGSHGRDGPGRDRW